MICGTSRLYKVLQIGAALTPLVEPTGGSRADRVGRGEPDPRKGKELLTSRINKPPPIVRQKAIRDRSDLEDILVDDLINGMSAVNLLQKNLNRYDASDYINHPPSVLALENSMSTADLRRYMNDQKYMYPAYRQYYEKWYEYTHRVPFTGYKTVERNENYHNIYEMGEIVVYTHERRGTHKATVLKVYVLDEDGLPDGYYVKLHDKDGTEVETDESHLKPYNPTAYDAPGDKKRYAVCVCA